MSIEKIRLFLEKSGCALIVGILITLVFIFSLASVQCGGNKTQDAEKMAYIASIGNYHISSTQIDQSVQEIISQYMQGEDAPDPLRELEARSYALNQSIDQGIILKLAKDQKIDLSDDLVINKIGKQFDQSIENFKMQYLFQQQFQNQGKEQKKKSKAEQEKEFEDFFVKKQGKDIKTFKDETLKHLKDKMKDPSERGKIEASVAPESLIEKYSSQMKVSEEDVKKSYDVLVLKEITFVKSNTKEDAKKPAAKQQAEKALKEIQGGLPFEKAMEKYSASPQVGDKKISERTIDIPIARITDQMSWLSPIKQLKPGEISNVISIGEQATLFKLVKIDTKLPKDYDKKKLDYQKQFVTQKAQQKLGEELKQAKTKKGYIKWDSQGYELLFEYSQAISDPIEIAKDPVKFKATLTNLAHKAESKEKDTVGSRVCAYVKYACIEHLWSRAEAKDKTALRNERIDAIQHLLEGEKIENVTLRIELVKMLLDKKDVGAGNALLKAAEFNNSFGQSAEANYNAIVATLKELKKTNLVSTEEEKKINTEIKRWEKEKSEYNAYQEKLKKEQEEERKKAEKESQQEKKKLTDKETTKQKKTETNSKK